MCTSTVFAPMPASIEALLDRLDPTASGRCTVPGCRHHHPEPGEGARIRAA
jgi:hypothetical protein